jgi:FK506-binding protein 1
MGFSKTVPKDGDGPAPKVGETITCKYIVYLKDTNMPESKGNQLVYML